MSSAFEGLPKTPNLKLNKPGYDNVADIEALNENADILDEEIQGIKNTFVKSVNGINAGDGGNVDLGIIPIAKGGTGQTTASGVRNALGLGNTTGALPIANGGTGATTAKQARENLEVEPIGTIFAFAGNNIPSGYLPCNGSAISRTTYADLFAVIGTTYGAGDGSTTFNLPNLNNNSFLEGSDTAGAVKSAGLPQIWANYPSILFANKSDIGISGSVTSGQVWETEQGNAAYGRIWSIQKVTTVTADGAHWIGQASFSASRCSSVYRDDITTVQPKAVTVKFCIKY